MHSSDKVEENLNANTQQTADKAPQRKTQFVVTLNGELDALSRRLSCNEFSYGYS